MSVDPEIFTIFQHKVERTLHLTRVTEARHIYLLNESEFVIGKYFPRDCVNVRTSGVITFCEHVNQQLSLELETSFGPKALLT